ncbi:putative integral membrane protein [Pseudonocardia sp. Ae717_Ps2]|uniref:SCO6880 family protein n=2 Tax=unclassified Pseudonocardia TaxID=2619320 RepID=UPI00094B67AA|nr:SCO6880 family protein [Pseudonocardia sp. Ae717_Ps2]OLM29086.1 putative integral membrane protein [Pseudonocardia sp. Ae717_Ps2]
MTAPRTYGNWRPPRGFGIGQLGTGQTMTVFLAIAIPVTVLNFSGRAGSVALVIGALVIGAVVIKIGGISLSDVVMRRLRFTRSKAAGWTDRTGGMVTDHLRRHDLPGPMGPIVPLSTDDGRGGKQGLLWDRRTGWLTAVLRVSPVGLDLADPGQADAWVANWGAFLADLGYQPMIRHVAVTVDTSPTGGTTLRDYVNDRIDPRAPASAQAVMAELAATAPSSSAEVDCRVSVTFDPALATPRPPDLAAGVAEVTRWLPGLESHLAMAGVAVRGRATAAWLTGRLRVAYDPASRSDLTDYDEQADELLRWSEAGPVSFQESWDHWQHDSGLSVSWAMVEAPRQSVMDRVLVPLLAAGPFARRMTLLYEPLSAGAAADEVEREITNTQVRRMWAHKTKRDETQRDRDDLSRAVQSAREEAEGAGVGRFTLYVTTTVFDAEQMPAATADVEQRAGQAKVRLRRLRGAQITGFAASLGLGINPAELARRPRK